jgi:hypothetical protein
MSFDKNQIFCVILNILQLIYFHLDCQLYHQEDVFYRMKILSHYAIFIKLNQFIYQKDVYLKQYCLKKKLKFAFTSFNFNNSSLMMIDKMHLVSIVKFILSYTIV